ncbi:response regulator [Neptuniibacter sp. QD48_55]|uniref:response regulator n=1 Tax=Neptuniibacter sp. QD48_55 TaxID=3398212 RepID=UPI0039F53ACD
MAHQQNILIVEDEVGLAEILRDYLQASGFSVEMIHNGLEVISWVKNNSPDMILLDLMLPGKDGMEICKEVRSFSNVPIIMTTARVEEIDRLLGLELGSDDYVCKPYSPREVVARVKAVMRRMAMISGETPTQITPIKLDQDRFLASIRGEELELTPVEFRMMQTFLDNLGRVFSRSQLMDKAYVDQRVVSDRTMDTHIKNLRKKMQPYFTDSDVIHSVYGVGYKFELPL